MKHMKKILAIALVAVTILAVAIPVMAAYRPWQYRWNAHTIYSYTEPAIGSELRQQITNLQSDINQCVAKWPSKFGTAAVSMDGIYGNGTAAAVTRIQAAFGLTQDGMFGADTKNKLWNWLGYLPVADE